MGASRDIDRFAFERQLLQRGVTRVAGVDEAGRGPLAGPVVAAAVVFPASLISDGLPPPLAGLNDSKQLTAEARERFFALLISLPELQFGIAQAAPDVIDRINILQATQQAMNEALAGLVPSPEHVLVDGLRVTTFKFAQTPIIKGDTLSYSIAAASVLAKVTRDRLMLEYDQLYPAYGFARHKGYGTADHLAALARHGPCSIHRRSFAPLKPVQQDLFSG